MTDTENASGATAEAAAFMDHLRGLAYDVVTDYGFNTLTDFQSIIGIRAVQVAAEDALTALVRAARVNGHTWEAIADQLGVTKQAAHARYTDERGPTWARSPARWPAP